MKDSIVFENAPVIEVVIGVQFGGAAISIQSIFEFYQKFKDEFAKIQVKEPLLSIIENMEGSNQVGLLPGHHSRFFFINETENKLIQLQPDRLLFNWRKSSSKEEYPHFKNVYEEFKRIFDYLDNRCEFKHMINQLEVTYLDHIIMDDFKRNDFNLNNIVNNFDFDLPVKSINNNVSFPVESLSGNLNLGLKSAIRNADQKKIVIMETTCRGSLNNYPFEKWFETAHKELLNFFIQNTTDEAKNKWGIKK